MKPRNSALTMNHPGSEPRNQDSNPNPSLNKLLNPDGSLNLSSGFNGSLDVSGYRMTLGPNGAPRFAPAALAAPGDENWDPQFFGSDISHRVLAIAVTSSDIYVGGRFITVGSVSANRVARYNIATRTWSALGRGSGPQGNGVPPPHGGQGGWRWRWSETMFTWADFSVRFTTMSAT
jgi:hypothetical protein